MKPIRKIIYIFICLFCINYAGFSLPEFSYTSFSSDSMELSFSSDLIV